MSLINEKHSKKYTQIVLFIFAIVIAVTFIQFPTLAVITVNSDRVYTNKITADIKLYDAVIGDKAYIVVPDEENEGEFKQINAIPYDVKSDGSGEYITINIPSKTNPDVNVTTVVNGEEYEVRLAFNVKEDSIIESNHVTQPVTVVIDTIAPTAAIVGNVEIFSNNNKNKTLAKNGDIITLAFTTKEGVQTPTVKILGQTTSVTETGTENGTSWKAEYTVKETDITQGDVKFEINFNDLAGNALTTPVIAVTDASKVTFDNIAPTAPTVSIISSNIAPTYATNGDKITIAFTTSEAVEKLAVEILGKTAKVSEIGATSTSWTAEYTIDDANNKILEGEVDFKINFEDLAGNKVTPAVTSIIGATKVIYDYAPRANTVNIVSDNIDKTYAKNGNKITITFKTSEAIQKPVVLILGKPVTATDTDYIPGTPAGGSYPNEYPATPAVPGNGTNWNAEYTILAAEATILEDQVEFSISLKALVGNEGASIVTATTDESIVTYDRTAPTASEVSIASNNNLNEYAKNGQTVIVSFKTNETTKTPIVTIFGRTATSVKGDGKNWTAEYIIPVDESTLTEAMADFSIALTDSADNTAVLAVTTVTDESSVKYDRIAPTALTVTLTSSNNNNNNKKYAKNGDKITAEFTTSEPIQAPTVTILGKETVITGSGTSWKAEYTIDTKEVSINEGDVEFTINFKDMASNDLVSTVTSVTDESSVNYDCTMPKAPTVNIVSSNINPIFARNGDKVTSTFVTSKTVQIPTVKIHGREALVTADPVVENTWIAEYTIPLVESSLEEGVLSLSITLLDFANNETIIEAVTDSSKVIYDRTEAVASSVNIVSNNNNPIYARNGDKITIAFDTSEIIQRPIVTILGKSPIITEGEIKNGTSWIAEYTILADEKLINEGEVDFTITFKDLSGNDTTSVLTATQDGSIVTYDRTEAKAISVNLISTNTNEKYAKNGDVVTVKFATSEIVKTPKVTILGHKVEPTGDGSGKNWTADYTIVASEDSLIEGNVGFSIYFKDLADNEVTNAITATNDNSAVNYDRTVPIAAKISVEKIKGTSYAKLVKNGDQFKVIFTLSDTNSGINPDYVKCKVGITEIIALKTKGAASSGEYEAVFTVDNNTLAGIVDYDSLNYTINFIDVAGNSGHNISASTGIRNDNVDPEINYFINGVNTNASELKPYYKDNKLIIQVKEHNFDSAQVILENSQINKTNWVNQGNDIWQMAITLPDGDNYRLKVNVTDKGGNLTSNDLTRERLFNIDTKEPQIKYLFNGNNTDTVSRYYKTTQQVAVQITEHNFNSANTIVTGNGITKTSWKNKGNDIWEMSLNLGEANDYTLDVSTTDKAENKFNKNLGIFTVDITKPALEIKNIMAGFFTGKLDPKVVYSDKNLDSNAVSIKFNGVEQGSGKAVGDGFEKTFNIKKDGSYKLVASVSDLAGNQSTADIQFVLDNTAPNFSSTTINLKDPIAFKGGWIIQKELKISDTNGYDIITCTLNGMDWDINKPITNEGKNVIYLEAKDKAGNMSKLSYQFFLDNTPPKLIVNDVTSSKSLDNSEVNPVFISQMKLRIALDKMEIGNEKPDYFTDILLKDKDGNVVTDILHNVTPKDENDLSVYYLSLSEFQTYTLVVSAKDQVGNDLNKSYTFTLKDKSIFKKYYDNKPILYTTTSLATVLVFVLIGLFIIKLGKKKVEVEE